MEDLESCRVPNSQKREAQASTKLDAAEAQLKELRQKNLVLPTDMF
jgi:hypothetical protein